MKKLVLLSMFVIALTMVRAQDPIFLKGDKVVNVGIGLDEYTNLSLSGEYCIADNIAEKGSVGVGAYAGFGLSLINPWYYSSGFRGMGGLRGTFHYPFIEKLDTYAGFGLGLQFWSWTYDHYYSLGGTYSKVGLNSGFFIGARYPISNKLTVFGEAGYGLGYLTGGISFKL